MILASSLAGEDELYALKRVGWPQRTTSNRNSGGRLTAKVSLSLPPQGVTRAGGGGVRLVVLSDGYMGWEKKVEVELQNTSPTTTATTTATTPQDIPGAWVENK